MLSGSKRAAIQKDCGSLLCPQDALEFVFLAMLLEFLAVHQSIGLLQHIIDVVDRRDSCGTAECNADLRRLEVRLQPFQQRCGIFLSFDFLHHEEFIAAHAEDGSLVTDVAEDFGCGADELVAGFVAERVIRLLEPVEVAEDKGDAPSGGQGRERLLEAAPVQQPCELVGFAQAVEARRFIMSRLRSRIAKKRVSEASRSDA